MDELQNPTPTARRHPAYAKSFAATHNRRMRSFIPCSLTGYKPPADGKIADINVAVDSYAHLEMRSPDALYEHLRRNAARELAEFIVGSEYFRVTEVQETPYERQTIYRMEVGVCSAEFLRSAKDNAEVVKKLQGEVERLNKQLSVAQPKADKYDAIRRNLKD